MGAVPILKESSYEFFHVAGKLSTFIPELKKHSLPIVVTPSGIVNAVRFLSFAKAPFPISVISESAKNSTFSIYCEKVV